MEMDFLKYQGAGNDFIMMDNRVEAFPKDDVSLIAKMCDRRFGIGADGLILLENEDGFDFRMVYFNADGRESSMCGNGGRCIAAFAKYLGVINKEASFLAIDGPHVATIVADGMVRLGMQDVHDVEILEEGHYLLDTGSPHYVIVLDTMPNDIVALAKEIRFNKRFQAEGVNVNFIVLNDEGLQIRTYERGVEDETLACGTGSVAAAIVASRYNSLDKYKISTQGGDLYVDFKASFQKVFLEGPATFVYSGTWSFN